MPIFRRNRRNSAAAAAAGAAAAGAKAGAAVKAAKEEPTPEPQFSYVVRGARIFCVFGTHMRRLDMPVCHGSYIREKPMMHERDCRIGLTMNIAPFGGCYSPENTQPEIIISDATDIMPIPTEEGEFIMPEMPVYARKCVPQLGSKWCDAHEDTLVDGIPALRVNCSLGCRLGGSIHFLNDGQEVG